MKRLPLLDPAIKVQALEPTDLATQFDPPDPATEQRLRPLLEAASAALAPMGCDVLVRGVRPALGPGTCTW